MCDEAKFKTMEERVDELSDRVDNLDTRLVAVETSLTDMRNEFRIGFRNLDAHLKHIYEEKQRWGDWLRANLPKALKIAWWSTLLLIGLAIGVNNLPMIAKFFGGGAT